MSPYSILKYVHILFAVIAVGFSASYSLWLFRARAEPQHLSFALRGVRFMDRRFTNLAYVGLLLTGLTMVLLAGRPLTTLWIGLALILYAFVVAFGIIVYAPVFRRFVQSAEQGGWNVTTDVLFRRSLIYNAVAGLTVLVIIALMVLKPTV